MKSKVIARGEARVVLRGPDGKVKDVSVIRNLVVTTGRQHIADQMADQGEAAMSHMAIGTGTTTQVLSDTTLETELNRKALASKIQLSGGDGNKVEYVTNWAAGEGTGAITEAAIFNAVSGGVMLNRTTFAVKNKGAGDSLSITWTITYTG